MSWHYELWYVLTILFHNLKKNELNFTYWQEKPSRQFTDHTQFWFLGRNLWRRLKLRSGITQNLGGTSVAMTYYRTSGQREEARQEDKAILEAGLLLGNWA